MIIQFSVGQLSLGIVSLVLLISFVQWLLAIWIKGRLEKSIQHEYDKKLEDYKFSQLQRQKAEIIARLFARWIKYIRREKDFLDKKGLIDYYEELNQMSLELSLWIPDENILNDIMDCLMRDEKAKDIRTLIVEIRKLMLNNRKDSFNPQKLVLWDNQVSELLNSDKNPDRDPPPSPKELRN